MHMYSVDDVLVTKSKVVISHSGGSKGGSLGSNEPPSSCIV